MTGPATTCKCCGGPAAHESVALVAACDMLVLRALELLGKRIVRLDRSRFARFTGRPFHEAHLMWQPDDKAVEQALADAWTTVDLVLDEHGCCGITVQQLTLILDRYVRDLVVTMTGHSTIELRYRLGVYIDV